MALGIRRPTLINAGTIGGGSGGPGIVVSGAAGNAVQFGSAAGTLVVDPGAVFDGLVVANTQADDVLELGVGNGNQGTLSGLGSQYTGFSTFTEDGGALAIGGSFDLTSGTLAAANGISLSGSLTVGSGAALIATGAGITAVTASSGAYLLVDGSITGAACSNGSFRGGTGGAGISLAGGMAVNDGTVTGGGGSGSGGGGGSGISLSGGGMATNDGTVTGGGGGYGVSAGTDGAGISLSGGAMVTNDGNTLSPRYGKAAEKVIRNLVSPCIAPPDLQSDERVGMVITVMRMRNPPLHWRSLLAGQQRITGPRA